MKFSNGFELRYRNKSDTENKLFIDYKHSYFYWKNLVEIWRERERHTREGEKKKERYRYIPLFVIFNNHAFFQEYALL